MPPASTAPAVRRAPPDPSSCAAPLSRTLPSPVCTAAGRAAPAPRRPIPPRPPAASSAATPADPGPLPPLWSMGHSTDPIGGERDQGTGPGSLRSATGAVAPDSRQAVPLNSLLAKLQHQGPSPLCIQLPSCRLEPQSQLQRLATTTHMLCSAPPVIAWQSGPLPSADLSVAQYRRAAKAGGPARPLPLHRRSNALPLHCNAIPILPPLLGCEP